MIGKKSRRGRVIGKKSRRGKEIKRARKKRVKNSPSVDRKREEWGKSKERGRMHF